MRGDNDLAGLYTSQATVEEDQGDGSFRDGAGRPDAKRLGELRTVVVDDCRSVFQRQHVGVFEAVSLLVHGSQRCRDNV